MRALGRLPREVGMFVVLSMVVAGIGVVMVLGWIIVKVFRLEKWPDPTGHGGFR